MFDIYDIAHAQANLCRFTGHVRQFYSVAQHSVLVARECPPEFRAWGLMHDAGEAYINDIARPMKHRTCMEMDNGTIRWLDEIEHVLLGTIAERFNLPWPMPEGCLEAIKHIDTRMLLTEKRDLMCAEPAAWGVEGDPFFGWHIDPWPPQRAKREFLRAATNFGVVKAVTRADDAGKRPILDEAAEITSTDRREAYGHPVENFRRIAEAWEVVLGDKLQDGAMITAQDVAKCMIGLKLARETFTHRRDNLVDIAGYARTLAIIEGDEPAESPGVQE